MTERAVARMFCMNARYTNQNVLILPPARSLPAHLLNVLSLKKSSRAGCCPERTRAGCTVGGKSVNNLSVVCPDPKDTTD